MKIHILTPQVPLKRGFNDFFPIIKWRRAFRNRGINFSFFNDHRNTQLFNCDQLILDYRYVQYLMKGKFELRDDDTDYSNESFAIDILEKASARGVRRVMFDSADSGGSRAFGLTPHVDIHLKKQVFKNQKDYEARSGNRYMVWLPESIKEPHFEEYPPCDPSQLDKIRLSWNIGMVDYRYFPFKQVYPIGTAALLNSLYRLPNLRSSNQSRTFLLSYRGRANRKEGYNYQRNLAYEKLESLKIPGITVGPLIPYKAYMKEQMNSRITFSPFGWGEICYRDFEAIINGSLLLKPSVNHLRTFPDFFIDYETYIPVQWNLNDLEETINELRNDASVYNQIIERAQSIFLHYQSSSDTFIEHFKRNVIE